MNRFISSCQLVSLLVLLSLAASSGAAELYTVSPFGGADFTTISAAVAFAGNGDTIELANALYTGSSNKNIVISGKSLTIRSMSGSSGGVVIDCGGSGRAFTFSGLASSNSVLNCVTIRNGGGDIAGCAIHTNYSAVSIENCVIEDCASNISGGGMYCTNGSSPTVTDTEFDGNSGGGGGAALVISSVITFDGCTFTSNTAWSSDGAGIKLQNSTCNVSDCRFSYNTGSNSCDGGAISVDNTALVVENTTFSGNEVSNIDNGGAVFVENGSIAQFISTDFFNNTAGSGGGIYCTDAQCYFEVCEFVGQQAALNNGQGGAVYYGSASSGDIDSCKFNYNQANAGAALYLADSSAPLVASCLFVDNIAHAGGGGAIFFDDSSPLVTHSTFDYNGTPGSGGAFRCDSASPTIRFCTLHESYADYGAAMALYNGSEPNLLNCIIAFSQGGQTVWFGGTNTPNFTCSNIWGNYGGNWHGYHADQLGVDGNIEADPLFCSRPLDDFTLDYASPCTVANSPCGQMGSGSADCGSSGVQTPPEKATLFLSPAWPNPFSSATSFRFVVPDGRAVLEIFDVAGRKVRTMAVGGVASEQDAIWDGCDGRGRRQSAGTYFCRLRAGRHEMTQRLVLLR